MTQSCRINGEPHTWFPYNCALSHVMRVKRLLHGLSVEPGYPFPAIREHTFMDNPNVPEDIKVSSWNFLLEGEITPFPGRYQCTNVYVLRLV